MIYPKYGKIFKQIREQKEFPLSYFSEAGLSKTTISQFENGKQMMGFDKLLEALQTMHVSLEEFELLLNDYAMSDHEVMINALEEAEALQDEEKLKSIYEEAKNQHYKVFDLVVKGTFCQLDESELEMIVDYLYEITVWSCLELSILYFSIDYLKQQEIIFILNKILNKKTNLLQYPKYRTYFARTSCKAVAVLSLRGYKDCTNEILNRLEKLDVFHNMFEKNLWNLTKGFWCYCFVNKKLGLMQMEKALEVFESLGLAVEATYYKNRSEYYIKRLENKLA